MKLETIFSHYGPGGKKCLCCGPAPSTRKKFNRMVKRRINQAVKKEIEKTLSNQ